MKYMLSIIIPAYNAATFIEKPLKTVIAQAKNKKIEIIVVDDGSTDSTSDVVRKYSDKYSFVRSIRTTNYGPAAARNIGLDEARGTYVWYIDSDDAIKKNAIAKLWKEIENGHSDLIIFGFDTVIKIPLLFIFKLDNYLLVI